MTMKQKHSQMMAGVGTYPASETKVDCWLAAEPALLSNWKKLCQLHQR
jgi:hypothetical protein